MTLMHQNQPSPFTGVNRFGFLFDMDGVVVDSTEAHFSAFKRLGDDLGVPFTRETLLQTMGKTNETIFPQWLGSHLSHQRIQDHWRQWAETKEEYYRSLARIHLKPVRGIEDLVSWLASHPHFGLAVGSSGPRVNVHLGLDLVGLFSKFRGVLTGDDIEKGKPDPEIFLKAAAALDLPGSRCLVFEDAVAGVQAGRAAGAKVLGLATTHRPEELLEAGAHWVVKDHIEGKNLLEDLLRQGALEAQ